MASECELDCSERGNNTDILEDIVADITQLEENNMDLEDGRITKRLRENNEEEIWTTVSRNSKKKARTQSEFGPEHLPIQICVTSKEKLPKQFALAKLLQQNNIADVIKVKYVNPYKILVNFENESSADKFLSCSVFDNLNWRRQKTSEVGLSYGIIRDIDLELSEEELGKYLISDKEIVSLKRLNRKNADGWTFSETIRIGFKGPSTPNYVYLFDVKIKVDLYVFPVTQCAKCWRYGHSQKLCPANKIICPKCANYHSNCQTKTYKCVNCSGGHMALSKNCPIYKREKRIRELMSEYNCTYQKAISIYVPPSPQPNLIEATPTQETHVYTPCITEAASNQPSSLSPSYAEVLQKNTQPDSDDMTRMDVDKNRRLQRKKKKKKKTPFYLSENVVADIEITNSEMTSDHDDESPSSGGPPNSTPIIGHQQQDKPSSFTELLRKLKQVIIDKNNGLVATLKVWLKIIIDLTGTHPAGAWP
ncbi:uncharacterized protein LOC114352369 [Ostrinia furnacalis]|uniref:uncharacterized protein LOC114352369 n=1 Tax=Ostrinia furnacalis TaxID=93504 RepID=UPI00103E41D0|nr:uncharacterized protein LOC114352369 [Ostrinia furnacalis]